jgi:hypothetical protein
LDTEDVVDRPRHGRPCTIAEEEKETFLSTVRSNPSLSLNQIFNESIGDFSKTYAWDLFHDNGFKCKTQRPKWRLDKDHRDLRLTWAKEYIKMPKTFWRRIIFSDETRVQHESTNEKYWFEEEESPSPLERDRWDASRLLWGAISDDGKCIFEVMNGTMNSDVYLHILRRRLLKNYGSLSLN